MERRELIKKLGDAGWYLIRNGGNHDIYTNGKDIEPIDQHKEIPERLARNIIKRRGL